MMNYVFFFLPFLALAAAVGALAWLVVVIARRRRGWPWRALAAASLLVLSSALLVGVVDLIAGFMHD